MSALPVRRRSPPPARPALLDALPDVRDGLTRPERLLLYALGELQREYGERHVPSAVLYGRLSEHLSLSPRDFEALLARVVGRRG